MAKTIRELSKVSVTLMARSERETLKNMDKPIPFEFIYGVGSEGLCNLELVLFEKTEGETISLVITPGESKDALGHLIMPVMQALGIQKIAGDFLLEVAVNSVGEADSREIVQSIAKGSSSAGCGGSCDCGCG